MKGRSRATGALATAAGVLALSLACLALLETGLRVAGRLATGEWPETAAERRFAANTAYNRLFRTHPWLHTSAREGASLPDGAVGEGRVHIDRLGYRSPERPLERPPGVRRVLVSGGSTTFDLGATHDRATWPWQLELGLREQGLPVEVWNAGLPTWTSLENVVSLAVRDLDLEPDVAVLYQGINDLRPGSAVPFDRHYERQAEATRRTLAFDLAPVPWVQRSIAVERARGWVGRLERLPSVLRPPPQAQRVERLPDEAVRTFERNVRSYVAIARSAGARVLLVTQVLWLDASSRESEVHSLEQWIPGLDGPSAVVELERLNDVVRRVAADERVALADVARDVAWADEDFGDPMHFRDAGSEKLARHLAPRVSALLAGVE